MEEKILSGITANGDKEGHFELPIATTEQCGLMSKEDKKCVNETSSSIGVISLEKGGINYGTRVEESSNRLIALGYNLFRYGGDKIHPKY